MALRKSSHYKVVIDHEEQCSLIPIADPLVKGWREIGKTGIAKQCLNYIEEVWIDMQPRDKEMIPPRIVVLKKTPQ